MQSLNDRYTKTLGMLVNSALFDPVVFEDAQSSFGTHANRYLVIDDFLQPHFLPMMRKIVKEEGDFEDNLKLATASRAEKPPGFKGPRGKVDAPTFAAAPKSDQFIRQQRLIGPKPEFAGSSAVKAEGFIRTMLASEPMHRWLTALTGIEVSETGGINLKLHGPGDFLKPHSDARPGRKLCAVIYLHESWSPGYDGRFVLHLTDGTKVRIDPLPNRMILFEATPENFHEIEPIGRIPEDWLRVNYTAWFS